MSYFYDAPSDTIRRIGDGQLIATMADLTEPDDSMKMAVAPLLYEALAGIIVAHMRGKLRLPDAHFNAGHDALLKATPPREGGPR